MTILKTQTAVINNKKVTVETITNNGRAQDISYQINGRPVSYNAFWDLSPKFKN